MKRSFRKCFGPCFGKSKASITPGNDKTDEDRRLAGGSQPVTTASVAQLQQSQSSPDVSPPYACTNDLWQEAYRSLNNEEKHTLEECSTTPQNETTKDIAAGLANKIRQVFDEKEQNKGAEQIIERAILVLNKFLSVGDVVASFDPVHAALPWAATRFVLNLLGAHIELRATFLAGISQVATLLAQCDIHQQLYMAGDLRLRPPETFLENLKVAVIEAYIRCQKFLSFTLESLQKRARLAVVFKLDAVREHLKRLSESEHQVQQVAYNCEARCNRAERAGVEKLLETAQEFTQATHHNTDLILETISDTDQLQILNWISDIPYGSHHLVVKEARTGDTCQWLMNHKSFVEWDAAHKSSIMWLHGSPGTGKTFLTSKVIDHVQTRLESKATEEAFAYFYCNRNEECRREPLSVLRALVHQLSTVPSQPKHIRKQLRDICREARSKNSHLGFELCRTQLLQSVNGYSQTTIILDALDECSPHQRWRLMEIIQSLICECERPIKVFIASRPDQDIKKRYSSLSNVEIHAKDNQSDIEKYVNAEINRPRVWGPISPSLRDHVVAVLLKRSQGMFQWAYLQVKQVLELPTEEDIRARLGKLPSGLKETYDEIYDKIKTYPGGKAMVDSAIMWLMAGPEHAGKSFLLDAVRFRIDTDSLHVSNAVSEPELLSLCNHLLVVDPELIRWRFSHLSVLEYFESNHWTLLDAHLSISKVCLQLLLITCGPTPNEITTRRSDKAHKSESDRIQDSVYHVHKYAIHNWHRHVSICERLTAMEEKAPDAALSQVLKKFLGAPDNTSAEYRKWYSRSAVRARHDGVELASIAAFFMCQNSIYLLLRDWWDEADLCLSQVDNYGRNLLVVAVRYGQKQMCEILIRLGLPVDQHIPGKDSITALIEAAYRGEMEMVQILLDNGADVNMLIPSKSYGSALVAAAWRSIEIVQLLLDNGADVNMLVPRGEYGSPLVSACAGRHTTVVKCLLDSGADANRLVPFGYYGSALAVAMNNWGNISIKLTMAQLLLDYGADANLVLTSGFYGSALQAACQRQDGNRLVQYLISRGADVNLALPHGKYGSALATAAFWGFKDIVVTLLMAGADIDLRVEREHHATAMEAAKAPLPKDDTLPCLPDPRRTMVPQGRKEVIKILEQWRDKEEETKGRGD